MIAILTCLFWFNVDIYLYIILTILRSNASRELRAAVSICHPVGGKKKRYINGSSKTKIGP
jgi:hypothetical protein